MRLLFLSLALTLVLPGAPAPAQIAEPIWVRSEPSRATRAKPRHRTYKRERYAVPAPARRVCVPWCRYDDNPCDPPAFKIADGRCSFFDNY